MQSPDPSLIRSILVIALIFTTLPASAQFRGRGDDSRGGRFERNDEDDSRDRRRFGPPRGRFDGNRDGRGRYGSSDDSDGDRRGRGGFSPDAIFDRVDDNGNGRIDGDEIDGRFKDFYERAGIEEGDDREDFTRGFERLREQRENRRDDDEDRDDRSQSQDSSPKGFTPREREQITYDLPDTFRDYDTNGDGQVAFHEWRDRNWERMDEFAFLDHNADGFLTPREAILMTEFDDSMAGALENSPQSKSLRSAGETANRSPASVSPGPRRPPIELDENNPHVQQGRKFFELLDRDNNGTASVAELNRLEKQRPKFERANIALDQPMTEDEFTANYYRAATFSAR